MTNAIETFETGYNLWPDFVIAQYIEKEDGCTLHKEKKNSTTLYRRLFELNNAYTPGVSSK